MRRPSVAFLLLTAATMVFLALHYGHVLRDPFGVMLAGGGDGLKNGFTFAWHVQHDPGVLTFTGANSPFGEHVFYTDGHPLLAWVLRLFGVSGGAAVGLLNLLLIGGMLIGAWCYHLLFRHFGLAPWAAALGALGLMALQPQVFRLGGHLSLAHAWPLPLAWWLTLRATEGDRPWRWTLLATALSTGIYLTHPYLGLMIGLFQGAFLAVLTLARWKTLRRAIAHHLRGIVLVIVPLLVLMVLFALGPQAADRPGDPGGSDIYATRILSLLLPTHPPFSTPLTEFIKYEALEWETWCYLGLTTILLLVALGGAQLRRWAARTPGTATGWDTLSMSLIAAFIVLLFAMGAMADTLGVVLPALKQFRGLGRFAWVFWTVAGVFVMTRAYHLLVPEGRVRWRGVALYAALAAFPMVEGWAQHESTGRSIGAQPNVFRADHGTADFAELVRRAQATNAQALIPLPLPHGGSEHYQRGAPEEVMGLLLPLAYHARLPVMAGITSRTSLSQTRALFALLAPATFDKGTLAGHIVPDAVLVVGAVGAPLDEHEQALWERAQPLHAAEGIELRTITAGELFASQADREIERYRLHATGWTTCGGARFSAVDDDLAQVDCGRVYQAFTGDTLFGVSNTWPVPAEFPVGTFDPGIDHEIGFLFEPIDPQAINTNLILDHFKPDGGENEWERLLGMRGMPMQWPGTTFAVLRFRPRHIHKVYKLLMNGPAANTGRYRLHHLYVRPVDVDVWREVTVEGRSVLLRNNVPLTATAP